MPALFHGSLLGGGRVEAFEHAHRPGGVRGAISAPSVALMMPALISATSVLITVCDTPWLHFAAVDGYPSGC